MAVLRKSAVLSAILWGILTTTAFAVQPALHLPPWAELSLRFTSPPIIGETTDLVGEMRCLIGEGEMGTLSLQLPPGLRVISGRPTVRVKLVRGRNQRVAVRVGVEKPCPKGRVALTLVAPYPQKGVIAQIKKGTKNREIQLKRINLVHQLKGKQEMSASLRLHVSHFESISGAADVVWRRVARGPRGKGLFILRPSPNLGNRKTIQSRIRSFERHENILRRNPRLRARVAASAKSGRKSKVVAYGENLFALATILYAEEPSCAPAIALLRRKAEKKRGVLSETVIALRNLEALALLHHGETKAAIRKWGLLCNDSKIGSLRAYALFNAGEATRISSSRKAAKEFFKAALSIRPGLTIARKRML